MLLLESRRDESVKVIPQCFKEREDFEGHRQPLTPALPKRGTL